MGMTSIQIYSLGAGGVHLLEIRLQSGGGSVNCILSNRGS